MERVILLTGVLLLISGSLFFVALLAPFSYSWLANMVAAVLILASGFLFITTARSRRVSFFVCGVCDKKFLTEPDLREHTVKHGKSENEKPP